METVRREVLQRFTQWEATQEELDTAVRLLQGRGFVYRLTPTPRISLILLQPERINQYASSIIQAARNHPQGIGAIAERDIISANLSFVGFERLEPLDEKIVLESAIELLIRHDLCFREMGMLVFPSQLNLSRSVLDDARPRTEVTYEFSGSVEAIYASLVVRLSYTGDFRREDLWKYAAEYSRNGQRLGFVMRQSKEGTGELEIYFHEGVRDFDRINFIGFATDHLRSKGINIRERIRLYCHQCGREVENRDAIEARVQAGALDITCQYCNSSVIIPRGIEEHFEKNPSHAQKLGELKALVARRTKQEAQTFATDNQANMKIHDKCLRILHLSDIHLGTAAQAQIYQTQLITDLVQELKVDHLDYLILSGDIANRATLEEYEAAFALTNRLVNRFHLDASRIILVPGNHDVNWDRSEDAYPYIQKRKLPAFLPEGHYIPAGEEGMLLRDEALYQNRFSPFSDGFYKKVYGGTTYPLDYREQAALHIRPDDQLLFLALNSCWELDHHFTERASINAEALSRALDQLSSGDYDGWLKIAVWHHPVGRREGMNDDFMQLLAVHGFQICMHGHIHEAIEGFYKYDARRSLHVIGAGTFGAPANQQVTSIPLQYNLLLLDLKTRELTVEARKKEKPDGAWMGDARWGDKNNPSPRYIIPLI